MDDRGGQSDEMALRRKRLRFRCWHRGTKELDLLLGPFADRHLDGLTDAQVGRLEDLIELPENDLYDWITGKREPPVALDHDVMALMLDFMRSR